MTDQLARAFEAARLLPETAQDEIADAVFRLIDDGDGEPHRLTDEERHAVRQSMEAAARGEFASDEEMEKLFAQYAR